MPLFHFNSAVGYHTLSQKIRMPHGLEHVLLNPRPRSLTLEKVIRPAGLGQRLMCMIAPVSVTFVPMMSRWAVTSLVYGTTALQHGANRTTPSQNGLSLT